ncbi:MAG: hypothetical protein VKJ46_03285, partial [Leptolyngbyaceae bacterium]|nr:hypothetical protein [Leptolyngbyaceae bacterium]
MGFAWRKIRRSPQTYILLVGAGLGYLCFILWLSPRLIVLAIGGAITLVMLVAWLWQFRQTSTVEVEANLLESQIFLKQLELLSRKVGKHSGTTWKKALQWARETQEFAAIIASREPTLTP